MSCINQYQSKEYKIYRRPRDDSDDESHYKPSTNKYHQKKPDELINVLIYNVDNESKPWEAKPCLDITATRQDTVRDIKLKIFEKTSIPITQQILKMP